MLSGTCHGLLNYQTSKNLKNYFNEVDRNKFDSTDIKGVCWVHVYRI